MEPGRLGTLQQATPASILDRRPDQGRAKVSLVRLADRLGRGDDRYALIGGEILGLKIFAMKDVEGRDLPPRTVRLRDRDVDLRRVDVSQLIETEGGVAPEQF